MSRRTQRRSRLSCAAFALIAGCQGDIAAPVGPHAGPPSLDDGAGGDAANGAFEPAAASLHRLTNAEYVNSVRDLLGSETTLSTELEADTPLKGFTSIGASELTIAHTTAEKLESAALELAKQVFEDSARRTALVGCTPEGASDPCVATFVKRFGRRAFRRPLSDEESSAMLGLAKELEAGLGDVWQSLSYVVAAFLQSPDFVFRVEVGEPDPAAPERLRFSSLEMASRLSFVLTQSAPDDALLDAGERGELVETEALRREATRLVASERFDDAMVRFFAENLSLDRLAGLSKDPEVYPQMAPGLPSAMRGELELMFRNVVLAEGGDYRNLFDTRVRYVNEDLARVYGVEGVSGDGFLTVMLPEGSPRAGLLGAAGLMAIQATTTNTSPTRRGKFIRNRLLCQEVPPPPPGADTTLPPADASQTMRERLTRHREDPECAGCHVMMDPLGLALENFDGIGAYRTDDRGMALDLTGTLDGVAFDGPVELAGLLKQNERIGPCVVQQLYRFATGHQESAGERPVLDDLNDAFLTANYDLSALALALVTSPGFRTAQVSP